MRTILVTGGAGFIGSAVIRHRLQQGGWQVVNLDALTYAGNLDSLGAAQENNQHVFEHVDLRNRQELDRVLATYKPDAVMHLAAESHVDRSIEGPSAFVETNVMGTQNLLEAVRLFWQNLDSDKQNNFRFHHVSTDEVYGDLSATSPAFSESSPYNPSSPYAASKAASDHLVRAWYRTYGLPIIITNCSNNYGPYQFPEKLIPLMILNALEGKPLPVYGNGQNIRDWLHVEDHAKALWLALERAEPGETYNIGGREERTNLQVVEAICHSLDQERPQTTGSHFELITFVEDRPGHDRRYAINDTKINADLGWQPERTFEEGLRNTINWYIQNPEWVERVRSGAYRDWMKRHYMDRLAMERS